MKKFISSVISSVVYGIFVYPALVCYLTLASWKVKTGVLFLTPDGKFENVVVPVFSGHPRMLLIIQLIGIGLLFLLANHLINYYKKKITNVFSEHIKQSACLYLYLIGYAFLFFLLGIMGVKERQLVTVAGINLVTVAGISLYAIIINAVYVSLAAGKLPHLRLLLDKAKYSNSRQRLLVGAMTLVLIAFLIIYLQYSIISGANQAKEFWDEFLQTKEGQVKPAELESQPIGGIPSAQGLPK